MMINCKESAIRSSELLDRRIKGMRKIELWYHLLMCKLCRMYNKQISMLGKLSQTIGQRSGSTDDPLAGLPDEKLSEDAKTRIKQRLTIQ
ncbi:MAG: hypothetical protein JSW50_07175 [Candidatus Latescibacterota bacterium]|nr:MAG: hypothetical protein JSW50_07175 [Candidatus Latescibacterota bacterium]